MYTLTKNIRKRLALTNVYLFILYITKLWLTPYFGIYLNVFVSTVAYHSTTYVAYISIDFSIFIESSELVWPLNVQDILPDDVTLLSIIYAMYIYIIYVYAKWKLLHFIVPLVLLKCDFPLMSWFLYMDKRTIRFRPPHYKHNVYYVYCCTYLCRYCIRIFHIRAYFRDQ